MPEGEGADEVQGGVGVLFGEVFVRGVWGGVGLEAESGEVEGGFFGLGIWIAW